MRKTASAATFQDDRAVAPGGDVTWSLSRARSFAHAGYRAKVPRHDAASASVIRKDRVHPSRPVRGSAGTTMGPIDTQRRRVANGRADHAI